MHHKIFTKILSIAAGKYREAGLPNITGSVAPDRFSSGHTVDKAESTGALSIASSNNNDWRGAAYTGDVNTCCLMFDASKSNSIYSKSNTVQPPAVTILYIIKY